MVLEGAVGGPVAAAVPENISNYFESRFQEILKSMSNQFKSMSNEFRRTGKEMDEKMSNVQLHFATNVGSLADRVATVEHKKQATDVDIQVIKNKVRQLPSSGNIQGYFEERNLNESVAANLTVTGDDSLDSSYSSRANVLAKFKAPEYVVKRKEKVYPG